MHVLGQDWFWMPLVANKSKILLAKWPCFPFYQKPDLWKNGRQVIVDAHVVQVSKISRNLSIWPKRTFWKPALIY